jgi:hypothetical protein
MEECAVNAFFSMFFVFGLIVLAIFIALRSRRHRTTQDSVNEEFLRAEEAANSVRKKEISPELFYEADLSALPPIPEGDPHKVERAAKRVMIKFDEPMSNLELKQQYGPAQMGFIAQYEENFNEYLKALTAWAGSVMEAAPHDARAILEHAIMLGSEFRNTYKLASSLYNNAELSELEETINDMHFHDEAVRKHILDFIDEKRGASRG